MRYLFSHYVDEHLLPGQTLIDYGCGSGILAIAAKKLGATKIWAIDHDPQALQATNENAHRNQITEADFTVCSPPTLPPCQADILIANILAQPLVTLASHFTNLLHSQGTLVLSGLLAQQIADIKTAYGQSFAFHTIILRDDWVLLAGQKRVKHQKIAIPSGFH